MKRKNTNTVRLFGIIISACLLYMASAGLRTVYGVMLNTISEGTGIAYASVSLAIAIGQLVFGVSQPIFGVVAIKTSKRFVLMFGSFMMGLGLALIPFCKGLIPLIAALGVIVPIGTGAVSFGMIMGVVSPKLGEEKAVTVTGLVNASSGFGGIIFSPVLQKSFAAYGLTVTMMIFAAFMAAMILVSWFMCGKPEKETKEKEAGKSDVKILLKTAFSNKSYIALLIGFFTCGFHMAIIETHLFSQIVSYGIAESVSAMAFSVYGIATLVGCLCSGFISNVIPMRYVLGVLYGSRVIWPALLLLLPKNEIIIIGIVVLLGFTGAATLTPTSGLTDKLFGADNLATLFGVVFLSHQLGSFFSSWIGGKCVELTGDYVVVWCIAMGLSLIACIASLRIKER